MKAFVTGGTGFIGSHLVDRLLQQGDTEVSCLVRGNEKWLKGRKYNQIKGDLQDLDVLKHALKGVDIIFHNAALVKAPNWQQFEVANVDAAENLVRIAQKVGVSKVVILSSQAAAGPSSGIPVSEDSPMKPVSMYGESKKLMEERIEKICKDGYPVTIVRPPAVYGPREENIFSFFKSASKGLCPIVGNGKSPKISLTHVHDLVSGIILAANYPHEGIEKFYISSEETYNWNQIKDATSFALGRKLLPLKINANLVKKAGVLSETVSSLFGSYPIFNKEKAIEMTLEWTCSVDKAKKLLGYRQTVSLEHGILDTIRWYQKHHWI
ncbi:NAD(P)-dependent oxidoreductase [bacterium]|nr:MAG: NAD(P)-dependent oxidoreductase [bacterium]